MQVIELNSPVLRVVASVLATISVIGLVGCASYGTDGPVKISDDLYMIGGLGGPLDHSGSAVKAKFFKQAAEHCAGMGREMVPVGSTAKDAAINWASAEVQYRCVRN